MLTNDAKAIVALTTRLGSPSRPSLTAQAWSRFAQALTDAGYEPSAIFGLRGSIDQIPGVEEPELIEALLGDASSAAIAISVLQQRGIWTLTISDAAYPDHLLRKLGKDSPPVLFGVGGVGLLRHPAIGVVGSRDVGEPGRAVAEQVAHEAVRLGFPVVSGGARGVDQISMNAAYQEGGKVIGVLADSLSDRIRSSEVLNALDGGSTCLITPQSPSTGFSPAAAMGRNKTIYGLSEATVVVACDLKSGGTWAGATEALKKDFTKVLVWRGEGEGQGNQALVDLGAIRLSEFAGLGDLLESDVSSPKQVSLFDGVV